MTLKDVDLIKLSKLTSQQIDQITCLECCKYFIAPETAACGHTLCHSCWSGRRICPSCSKPFERRNLRHNRPIQNLTEHVHALSDAFEKLFNIKLDEFLLDTGELESEEDPTKNVKDWLASSQNHFSAPVHSSEQSSQEIQQPANPLQVSSNKIQVHTITSKAKSPEKIVLAPIPQDDWDKIESMPDTEDIRKDKENIVGPMDIEPFAIDDNEYTVNNPRRSSRKRELKPTEINNKMNEKNSFEKQSSKDSSGEIDKKSNKTKQNWNSVKRMRKEFSKLNKKNKNKLNVSIEMCKKTQNSANNNVPKVVSSQIYEIDENTPNQFNIDNQILKETFKEQNEAVEEKISKENIIENINDEKYICQSTQIINKVADNIVSINNDSQTTNAETKHSPRETTAINATENINKMPFYKRGALHPKSANTKNIQTINHNIETDAASPNDDIEITIKVGNTITNIFIKKKNQVELKVNTDREIQTSLGPYELNENLSPQNTQNIVINVGENHKVDVDVENQLKKNPRVEELKKYSASLKTTSGKKNTDSADTATAQFEITESVEKELSKIMDQVDEPTKSNSIVEASTSQSKKSQKPATNPDNHEFLNDLDMFDSESVKESDVQLLKNTENAPSEILRCTFKTKNKTQKQTEKRDRDPNDEDVIPKSKKAKLHDNNCFVENTSVEKTNQNESESTNYDTVMDKVFANIDADIEEIRQSQDINKKTQTLHESNKKIEHANCKKKDVKNNNNKVTCEEVNELSCSVQLVNEFCNQKDSENIFSVCAEKEGDLALSKEKVLTNLPRQNIDEFLTPVMSRNLESTGEAVLVDNDNDDSDRSVVEETPQKTTSFLKLKQKSNGGIKDLNQIQNTQFTQQNLHTEKKSSGSAKIKSVHNLTDSDIQMKSGNNITAVEAVDKKSLETPLTINKFVGQIQHNSTPYARKSLNFDKHDVDDLDPEQTLCPTTEPIVKTTQEKEFMIKAFEKTPTTPSNMLGVKNLGLKNKKYRIAGSCLTVAENAKLKALCSKYKWIFTDKYSKDLTHLVVGVDDENKAQRSVKYMCALASSIWILSFEWVEKCLECNTIVNEDYFEALDSTGEPGPMRSRLATRKLFQGITFFCMEPFSVLDVNTLKGMLEAAGGKVVNESKEVKVTDKTTSPALLLAEPENTQEDRFIYLAMELLIVPVNYEWALNCLGSYSLGSIQELLLCPTSLLPKVTENWPHVLLALED